MGQVSDEYSNSTGVGNWPTLGFGFIYINLPYVNLFSHHLQTSSSKSVLSVTILFNILILLCVHLVAACLCCWAVVGHFTLGFSFQYKLSFTSCEHLGKSMRSSITQYMYISDMQWNQSCLLARRVLSHKTKQNWSHYFGLIYTFENFILLFTHLNHISSLW